MLPGESRRTRGRPWSSVKGGSSSSGHHESGRWLLRSPPFSAGGRTVRFDVGTIDGRWSYDPGLAGQSLEYLEPETLSAPAVEAVVNRRVGAVFRRTIPPARARPQHVYDPADHPPVVHPMRTTPSTRQQRFKALPLRLAQPVKLLAHQGLLESETLESRFSPHENPY